MSDSMTSIRHSAVSGMVGREGKSQDASPEPGFLVLPTGTVTIVHLEQQKIQMGQARSGEVGYCRYRRADVAPTHGERSPHGWSLPMSGLKITNARKGGSHAPQDKWCTVSAYFKVKPGEMEAFERLADQFVEKTNNESGIRYYGWSFDGDEAHCRQGYLDAEGVLEHAANVATLFEAALDISDCTRLAIHAPEEELVKLQEPLKGFNPQFFVVRNAFRR